MKILVQLESGERRELDGVKTIKVFASTGLPLAGLAEPLPGSVLAAMAGDADFESIMSLLDEDLDDRIVQIGFESTKESEHGRKEDI